MPSPLSIRKPFTMHEAALALGFSDSFLSPVQQLHEAIRFGDVLVWRYGNDAYLDMITRAGTPDELRFILDDLRQAARRTLSWRRHKAPRTIHEAALALGFSDSSLSPVQQLHEAIRFGDVLVWRYGNDAILEDIAEGNLTPEAMTSLRHAVERTMAWME